MRSIALLVTLLCTACATPYQPAASPRLSMVGGPWGPTLHRDGQKFEVGLFGGGLDDAVEGDADAMDEAESASALSIGGFVLVVVGAGAAGGGAGLMAARDNASDDTLRAVSISMLAGGLALAISGAIMSASAQTHMFNAINIYNDGLIAPYPPPLPQFPPPPPYVPPAIAPPPQPLAPPPAPPPPEPPQPEEPVDPDVPF